MYTASISRLPLTAIAGHQRNSNRIAVLLLLTAFQLSPAAQEAITASAEYRIDMRASILRVYVGKAGVLAGMGHNHIIVNRHISGMITTDARENLQQARLTIPVAQFSVDELEERRRAGVGFDSKPDESDRAATRNNMLGAAVLNAEHHPEIVVMVGPPTQQSGDTRYPVSLSLTDRDIRLELPAVTRVSSDGIDVESHFVLGHHELGLEPYSALGGILRVAEDIRFELILKADRLHQPR